MMLPSPSSPTRTRDMHRSVSSQSGLTLIELLIAITLGLLVIAAALMAVLVGRSLSGITSEAGQLQQKAAYAFRIMGQQIRQAGSRNLQDASTSTEKAMFVEDPKLASQLAVQGKATPSATEYALTVAFQNTDQKAFPLVNGAPQAIPLHRNCLGEELDGSKNGILTSQFRLEGQSLVCAGSGDAQPIIDGVSDFAVRYMLQDSVAVSSQNFAFGDASLVSTPQDWSKVYAVKICLELQGKEIVDTASATYTRCDGSVAGRGNRLRLQFRNTFHVHNKAW